MRLRRLLIRVIVLPILVVALPLGTILAGGYLWFSTSLPETAGTIPLTGLKAPVKILRDANGVPHIFASNDSDAEFALGFVHAQDRLWQMESMRRAATGHLAEIAGEQAVPLDKMIRTLDLEGLAEAQLAGLDPAVRAEVDAYTIGVNAYIGQHRGVWPPEFVALQTAPRPWRPVDSLVWGELMALQLSGNWRTEMIRAQLSKSLSTAEIAQLWPPVPSAAQLEIPGTPSAVHGALAPKGAEFPGIGPGIEQGLPLARLASMASSLDGRGASNAWAVDGAHSADGKPLLANDPHLGFSLPILWYLATLDTPTLHLAGATVPGVPSFILGHNDRIAWGMTTTGSDVEDLFVEKIDPDDPSKYLTPDGSMSFRTRTESIGIRGKPPVTITVRSTRHGPVISDAVEGLAQSSARGTVVALQATWLEPDNKIATAIYKIDRARDWKSFTDALKDFSAPGQTVAYADVDGHIGYYAAGRVPIRKSGDGLMPVPGWTSAFDWTGEVPFDALPHAFDPPAGRFANANDRLVPPDFPYFISSDGFEWPYRARRIADLLAAQPKETLDGFAAMQADSVSLAARDLLPRMIGIAPETEAGRAMLARLKSWDGTMDRERPEPLLFEAWLRELERGLFADKLGDQFPDLWGGHAGAVRTILASAPDWCVRANTKPTPEDCHNQIASAYERAMIWLTDHFGRDPSLWRWGDAHQAYFIDRVFAQAPFIGRFAAIHIPADGGDYTINRGAFAIANEQAPFVDLHGAGYRAIYDLGDLARSRFTIATGESGNLFSNHLKDFVGRWRDVQYVTLAGSAEDLSKQGAELLILEPKPPS
jgi:penicillin amidase